jgi:hypothetical protein
VKRSFFIFSLPRSGSSWLSVFLGGGGSFCYHEPFADGDMDFLAERISQRPELCVGAIDTSAHQREALSVPSKWDRYVLLRDQSQVERSLRLRGWVMDLDNERNRLLSAAAGATAIYYARLNQIAYLYEIWNMIVGTEFDQERAEYLVEMNIQRTFSSVKARVCSISA